MGCQSFLKAYYRLAQDSSHLNANGVFAILGLVASQHPAPRILGNERTSSLMTLISTGVYQSPAPSLSCGHVATVYSPHTLFVAPRLCQTLRALSETLISILQIHQHWSALPILRKQACTTVNMISLDDENGRIPLIYYLSAQK